MKHDAAELTVHALAGDMKETYHIAAHGTQLHGAVAFNQRQAKGMLQNPFGNVLCFNTGALLPCPVLATPAPKHRISFL